MKLDKNFYRRDTIQVAKELLGKKLVHSFNGELLSGIIVETEAYRGLTDKAAHSYGGRKTERTMVMFEAGGVSYIYFIYGLYYCFNVVATEKGIPEAVLIRAIEPTEGIEEMSLLRYKKNLDELNKTELKAIGNGPAKLCTALKLDKSLNGVDLTGDTLYIEDIGYEDFQIVETTRVGIDYAEEAKDFLWRFYIKDNKYISKKWL